MAIEAILQNGRMLIKERTSLLGVTGKAKLPVGKPLYELRRNCPVRVVATYATHFSLAQRMMRKPQLLVDLLFMTRRARIVYVTTSELITGLHPRSRVDRVALSARDAVVIMRASLPEKPLLLFMALEADRVARGNRHRRPLSKSNHVTEFTAT